MTIKTFYNNPFQEACYVVYGFAADEKACVLIDCGAYRPAECERIRTFVAENGLRPVAHLLTHAHLDHLFGARFLFDEYGLSPMLHEGDEPLYSRVSEQAEMFGIPLMSEPLDAFLSLPKVSEDGLIHFTVEGSPIAAIPTPGHTPGGVCYLIDGTLFSGDTLFQSGYGRTDLPGGDMSLLIASLTRLSKLPRNTVVYPGHGYPTSIGDEF